jgi:hypothetical protein
MSRMLSLPLARVLSAIPTYSYSYYATPFSWPVSDFRIYGIAWGTAWFWAATDTALVLGVMWRKGWLSQERSQPIQLRYFCLG